VRSETNVIAEPDVMPLLLSVCPGFVPAWRAHLEKWTGRERSLIDDAEAFSRYLVASYEAGNTSEFSRAFETLENVLRDGDDDARTAARAGVFGAMRLRSPHRRSGSALFAHWLGRLSRETWKAIEDERGVGDARGICSWWSRRG
jgi:hypothetical protein